MHLTPYFLSHPSQILAYLDPGSGSIILQLLLAVLLGGGILLKIFWNKIFHKGKKTEGQDENNEEHSNQAE